MQTRSTGKERIDARTAHAQGVPTGHIFFWGVGKYHRHPPHRGGLSSQQILQAAVICTKHAGVNQHASIDAVSGAQSRQLCPGGVRRGVAAFGGIGITRGIKDVKVTVACARRQTPLHVNGLGTLYKAIHVGMLAELSHLWPVDFPDPAPHCHLSDTRNPVGLCA